MRVLSVLLLTHHVSSFVPSPSVPYRQVFALSASRREILESAALASATIIVGPTASLADVADGNQLPDGVAQFARLIKVKADIPGVKQRLASSPGDIDKKEWSNIGGFLRRIYAEADDMKSVANSQSPDKKQQALEIAEQLRKYSKGGESSINEQDAKALSAVLDKCNSLLQEFFDLLSDIPDEI